ncbi:AI-2E family transporter [Oceanobacillus indicireducens]|uniref:AI-2E family transporter n=1 Tax=Oceanobacillus indicireducens TaxID=1004261 RepID=A0A917XXB5_9BACI|nr:AI-2E family transporter [Oceanobacillus indicireducens]GGN55751.1 AI-2E family transporter [Oceanobacillus indicireducens]
MKQTSRFITFLGGKNLFFLFALLSLIGLTIFIFERISFVFYPVLVIVSTITPPLILAFIAFYLLNPIVNLLERFRIKRIWGIIILILAIAGILTGVVLLTAPLIETQINDLIRNFPNYLTQLGETITNWVQSSFLAPYYEEGYNWVADNLSDLPGIVGGYLINAFESVQTFASAVTNIVVAIVTFPIILFFLLKDGGRFKNYFLTLLPPAFRKDVSRILHNMDTQVGSYIQGQIIVATCIGILLYIGYLIIGMPYALTLAIIAAVTSVVPYLGPTIAILPAIIISIVDSPFMLLKLAIVWAAVQFLEGNFISPNVMGRTMQIHPLTIIVVLLVAGNLFGIVGVILGIPGYAILKVLVQYLFDKFKQRYNKFFGEVHGTYPINEDETKNS